MRAGDAFPSNFFKESDLNDEEVTLTIKSVDMQKLGDDEKLVASFKGTDKKLVINKTNFKNIVKATGEEDTDDWPGKRVTLYPTETEFKGDTVPCIRIKSKPPKAEKAKAEKHPADDDSDDDFVDADGTEKF